VVTLSTISNAIKKLFENAPAESMSVNLKVENDNDSDAELYYLPGFFGRPHDGETGVVAGVSGFNIIIATNNYKINIPLEKGEGVIYSCDADGTILASAKCNKDGKFVVKNDTEDLKTIMNDLIAEVKAIITTGSPTSQTVSPGSQALLDAVDTRINSLLGDS